jgi:hypothetical protein
MVNISRQPSADDLKKKLDAHPITPRNRDKNRGTRKDLLILESNAKTSEYARNVGKAADRREFQVSQRFENIPTGLQSNTLQRYNETVNQTGKKSGYLDATLQLFVTDNIKSIARKLERTDVSRTHAVNMSYGMSETSMANTLFTLYSSGSGEMPHNEQQLLEENGKFSLRKAEAYVDTWLANNKHQLDEALQEYTQAVKHLKAKEVPVVVSAGNEGELAKAAKQTGVHLPTEKDEELNLLGIKDAIVVGAGFKDGELTDYSSEGSTVDFVVQANSLEEGTSFAAPHVAGKLAELMEQGLSAGDAESQLKQAGTPQKDMYGNNYRFLPPEVMNNRSTLMRNERA